MARYVHNKTQSTKTYSGVEISASSFYEIPGNLIFEFSSCDDLLSDITSGDVAISEDGSTDLSGVSNQIDFLKNGFLEPRDSSGRYLTRIATTIEGWHYQPHAVSFTTSDYDGIFNKTLSESDFFTESDLGFATIKLYDSNNTLITSGANESNAVKTVVDWMPTHDYEIVGAKYFQNSIPTNDIYLWIIGVPDLGHAYGGSIFFGQGGINLKHVGSGNGLDTDGRSSKYMTYNATYKTNKFRLVIKHPAGVQHTGMVIWETYKAP